MSYNLSKGQKKVARQIIEKGLQLEFKQGLTEAEEVLLQWRSGDIDNRDGWITLYKAITNHDKHIARRYDYITGSKYLFVIAGQLADDVITLQDLDEFTEENRKKILSLSGRNS